jgi:flavin reductase (DIM6/NTAB) family NADH-FMN oxidoreductase RutF
MAVGGVELEQVSVDRFRSVLGLHAGGVTVITVPGPAGFTATSFLSVSLDPPLVAFCVAHSSRSWTAVETAPTFVANILACDQEHVGRLFATRDADRFADRTLWSDGPEGAPVLRGAHAWVAASIQSRLRAGDHVGVLGRVIALGRGDGAEPLLYHRGRFCRLDTRMNGTG